MWKFSSSPPSKLLNSQTDLLRRNEQVTAFSQGNGPGRRTTECNADRVLEGGNVKKGLVEINATDPRHAGKKKNTASIIACIAFLGTVRERAIN